MMEQIIACLPATRVHFFQICTLTFGRPVPKFPFYSSTWEKQQKRIVGRVCTSGKQQNINTLLLPLRWQGCSLVTLVFSYPLINLHLNLSQTSWRLNLTTFSSERVLCVCVQDGVLWVCMRWPGFRVILWKTAKNGKDGVSIYKP